MFIKSTLVALIILAIVLFILYLKDKYKTKKWPDDAPAGQYICINSWAENGPSGGALNNFDTKCFAEMKKDEYSEVFITKILLRKGEIYNVDLKTKKPGE